jgi:hypothetical protein
VIVSGRAYDPSPTAAMAIRAGFDPALAWHMGKIMECGALCAEPVGRSVMGWLRRDHFEIEPINPPSAAPRRRSPPHALLKDPSPSCWPGRAATLDLSQCKYEQVSDRRVRVSAAASSLPSPTQ